MGGAVGDHNNDGWPDIYITCFGGNVLYRNNGDGTFTDVPAKAGVTDGRRLPLFGDYGGRRFCRSGRDAWFRQQPDVQVPRTRWAMRPAQVEGATKIFKSLAADNFQSVLEGKGIVAAEKIRPTTNSGQ
jgi:hypothetical protein